MCLTINEIHRDKNDKKHFIPYVSDVDVLVIKYMSAIYNDRFDIDLRWRYTPCVGVPVKIRKGIGVIKSGANFKNRVKPIVGKGVHAIYDMDKFPNKEHYILASYYPVFGYIPSGTRFFFGEVGDIVAEKIVILEPSKYKEYSKDNVMVEAKEIFKNISKKA